MGVTPLDNERTKFVDQLNPRELVPDFQSILVPGFAFVMSAWALLFLCYFSIVAMLAHSNKGSERFSQPQEENPGGNVVIKGRCCNKKNQERDEKASSESLRMFFEGAKLEILFFISVLSFTAGKVLYRLGEKKPDAESIACLTKENRRWGEKSSDIGRELKYDRWVFVKKGNESLGDEFPYGNLAGYLNERGLGHLCRLIPWRTKRTKIGNEEKYKYELVGKISQHFIRSLRTRLRYFAPNQCWRIDRIEGHIRMMASTWYSSRLLIKIGFIAIVVGAANLSVSLTNGGWKDTHWIEESTEHLLPLFLSTVIWAASLLCKRRIESFFHLQRVWGLIVLLETVNSAMLEVGDRITQDFTHSQDINLEGFSEVQSIQG